MAINGRLKAWEDITIKRGGVTLLNIENIKFKMKSDIARFYGKGRKTRKYLRKKIEGDGSMDLELTDWQAFCQLSDVKQKGVFGIDPFDIVVAFDNGDGKPATITLQDCVFTEVSFDGIQDDTDAVMVSKNFEILGGIDSDGTVDLI